MICYQLAAMVLVIMMIDVLPCHVLSPSVLLYHLVIVPVVGDIFVLLPLNLPFVHEVSKGYCQTLSSSVKFPMLKMMDLFPGLMR